MVIFPTPLYPFLNIINPIEFMMDVDFKILIRRNFLQIVIIINNSVKGVFFGFNCHDFSFIDIYNNIHIGAEIMDDFLLVL